jgi:hypothetical protein
LRTVPCWFQPSLLVSPRFSAVCVRFLVIFIWFFTGFTPIPCRLHTVPLVSTQSLSRSVYDAHIRPSWGYLPRKPTVHNPP